MIAAGVLAHLVAGVARPAEDVLRDDPRARRVMQALAIVVVLYAVQALYSSDLEHAVKTLGFFYVPFAIAFRLLVEVRWSRRLVLQALGRDRRAGAAVRGGRVRRVGDGAAADLEREGPLRQRPQPYFRVNSLFFDPNVYGRFLALVMVVLAGVLLWAPARRDVARVAVGLALLWAALVLTLSESSFAALLVGLAVLAALRWRSLPVLAVCGGGMAIGLAIVLIAPGPLGLNTDSFSSVNEASSGRAKLVRGGLRWRPTGRCSASARGRSPTSTASASACCPRASRPSRTRSRSRSRPSRA